MAAVTKAFVVSDLIGVGLDPIQAARIGAAAAGGTLPDTGDAFGGTGATGLTATGSVFGDALQLTAQHNQIGTVAASTGVKLYDFPVGTICTVRNSGANALDVYPPTVGGQINAITAGDPAIVAATEVAIFIKLTATAWICGIAVIP